MCIVELNNFHVEQKKEKDIKISSDKHKWTAIEVIASKIHPSLVTKQHLWEKIKIMPPQAETDKKKVPMDTKLH